MANSKRLALRAEYLRCRTWGHAWEEFIPRDVRVKWGELWPLRCIRCGTERFDTINALGHLGARRYVHPEDYALAKDETPTRDGFRVQLAGLLTNEHRGNGAIKRPRRVTKHAR